jgi:hypothetical protein
VVLVVATLAVISATRRAPTGPVDPAPAPVAEDPGPAGPPQNPALSQAGAASGGDTADTRASEPGPDLPAVTARVRVTPTDATIRAVGNRDSTWRDGTEVSVAPGDTMLLDFFRPGYVSVRLPFTGSRLSVALVPDSAIATFEANVPADIYLVTDDGEIRLGSTRSRRRLPTGTWTFRFRSPGQPDWQTTVGMTRAGDSYLVAKTDYATTGNLVATVAGGWAMASLDGGIQRETPAEWSGIAVGTHVLRLSRDGYRTVIDTVIVPAASVLRRQYTLERGS